MNVKFHLAKAVFSVLGAIPLPLIRAIGHGLGSLIAKTNDRNARIARKNIALCFPNLDQQQQQELLHQRMQSLGATVLEMLKIWGANGDSILQLIDEVEGRELIEEANRRGKGTIILAPHLGNWEVIGLFLTECNDDVRYMYSRPKSATMNELIVYARQRNGAVLVPADRSGVIQLLKSLRRRAMIGILPDQVPADESGEFAPFFGYPAFTMTLMSNLARKTGATIINAYALPTENGFKVVLSKPDEAIYSENVSESVAALNRTIEQCAGQHARYYQWEYKRFKRQPDGSASPY